MKTEFYDAIVNSDNTRRKQITINKNGIRRESYI